MNDKVNYACGFNQSETGKYFEWIIICITKFVFGMISRITGMQISEAVTHLSG